MLKGVRFIICLCINYKTTYDIIEKTVFRETPRPIGTPDERSKRRICVVLTPDCGSYHRRSTTGLIFFFFFFCIFTRLETLTICSCNYFTFKTFSINPQSTLVYGLLYRQGRKRGVLVKLGSWYSPHLKLVLHHLPLFQC